ncbi:hypothetical protein COP1_004618 [Malus domestica]
MGEPQEVQLNIVVNDSNEANSSGCTDAREQALLPRRRSFNWWLRMAICTVFVIAGQSAATLLARLYYDKGGKSKWLGALVQLAGFPILLPYYFFPTKRTNPTTNIRTSTTPESKEPSTLILASIYVSLGLLIALGCFLYSVGLSYLPVSTYSLICASQLAFNALFSFFLNSQKFTLYIVNALVLLTISSTLLVLHGDSTDDPSGGSKAKYAIGFICTLGASAQYSLTLSLSQLVFRKVIRRETFRVVMDMIVYQSLVATCAILVGLFGSGEWKGLRNEMEGYELGKVSYVMNLIWSAIIWQLFDVGMVGLVFEASSLFSNAINVVGLPVVPVVAVIFFHDKMDGIKAMALVLAIWGFVSYVYQHYLDDQKSKIENKNGNS